MRSKVLRLIMILLTVVMGVILIFQLVWLSRVYSFEKQQFHINVVRVMNGIYEDFDWANQGSGTKENIEKIEDKTYLMRVDSLPTFDILERDVQKEFNDFSLHTESCVAVYRVSENKFIFKTCLFASGKEDVEKSLLAMPVEKRSFDYIMLSFPHRDSYLIGQLSFWIVSSLLLLITLIGLAVSLLYLYRQRFLYEVQKDFVNNFTHEFKTPLAVMKITCDTMVDDNIRKQPERMAKYADIMGKQVEHLQKQVDKLLGVAYLEEHKTLPLEREQFSINEIIKQAVAKVEPLIESKNAKVDFKLSENGLSINADKAHIEQAFINLVENGLKYSDAPHIVIETGKDAEEYFIAVRDNGIGIDTKYQKDIFKKFFRVPTGDVHNVKGFGLGLNFVKKVIDAHHGKITVNSIPGIGTEFKIMLPTQ
ncbi:MAG: HAMP domain-containing histidine kinase [Sphingobacteriales bacterium]|nr:HAMP domain-containing histidine kinase [Sphingobacteriales bacterium]